MFAYVIKRLLSLIPILIIVSLVIFMIIHITPGGPATVILGMEATPEQIQEMNQKMGFDRPLYEQYFSWFLNVLKGDLGESIFMNQPVMTAILEHLGPTLELAIIAQSIAAVIAIPFGVLAAYKRGTVIDFGLMLSSLLGLAIPSFLLGLLLMLFFGLYLKWLPVAGYKPFSVGFWNHFKYLVLPSLSLGTIQSALITRMTRSSMLDVLHSDYIKTARSKGIGEFKVLAKHAFKNAALPILTVIGQTFGTLVTGAIVIESIFGIPGMGQLILNSITRRDFAVIQGVVLFVTIVYVIINLIVDLLYAVIDPRIRMKN